MLIYILFIVIILIKIVVKIYKTDIVNNLQCFDNTLISVASVVVNC